MKLSVITVVLSLAGASASSLTPVDAMRKAIQKINTQSRRLEGHGGGDPIGAIIMGSMNPACQEACSGAKALADWVTERMSATSTTTAAPGKEMEAMCPYMDAMACIKDADACKGARRLDAHGNATNATNATSTGDNATSTAPPTAPPPAPAPPPPPPSADTSGPSEESGSSGPDILGMMGCMCACPKLNMGGRRLESHGDASGEEDDDGDDSLTSMCADPQGTMGCVMTDPKCSGMKKMYEQGIPKDMTWKGYLGFACEWKKNDCEKKQKSQSCKDHGMDWEKNKCFSKATTDKSECCPAAEGMKKCQGETCVKLTVASTSMMGKSGEDEEFFAVGKACPAAGIPKSKDEVKAVMEEQEQKIMGEDTASDTSTSGAFVPAPVIGVAAAVLASIALCKF